MAFIHRTVIRTISGFLSDNAVVLVEGPPRSGKSTMARQLAASASTGAVLVDARLRQGRAILDSPGSQSAARPIILDNAERKDAERLLSWARTGNPDDSRHGTIRSPRFVLVGRELGKAGLAGASDDGIAWTCLGPLSLFEAGQASLKRLWLRGGYPEAFAAATDDAASAWLETYAADLSGGELAAWGMPREPRLISGLLQAVAATDGQAFNENAAARALGVSRPTIARYLGMLDRAGILFQVPALPPGLLVDRGSRVRSATAGATSGAATDGADSRDTPHHQVAGALRQGLGPASCAPGHTVGRRAGAEPTAGFGIVGRVRHRPDAGGLAGRSGAVPVCQCRRCCARRGTGEGQSAHSRRSREATPSGIGRAVPIVRGCHHQ